MLTILSRSALRPGQPVVPHHQPTTPAWDTEPGIDEDKARRNSSGDFALCEPSRTASWLSLLDMCHVTDYA
jgi:hypothetical protein